MAAPRVADTLTEEDAAHEKLAVEFAAPDQESPAADIHIRPHYLKLLPWALAVAMVIGIIIGLRLFASHGSSGSLSPTTIVHTPKQPVHHAVAPT